MHIIYNMHCKASEIRPTMSLSVLVLPLCLALLVNTMGDNVFGSEGDFQTKLSEMFDNEDFGDFGDVDLEFSPIADEDFRSFGDDDLLDFGTDSPIDDEEQKVRGKYRFHSLLLLYTLCLLGANKRPLF